MALRWPCSLPFASLHHSRPQIAIPRPLVFQNLTLNTSSSLSTYVSRVYYQASLPSSSSSSSSSSSMESDTPPPTAAFIKGLPESMTEGRLKKAFSQFGEVVRVQIVIEKISKQPLGSAFVWLTRKESADLAVQEMNGKGGQSEQGQAQKKAAESDSSLTKATPSDPFLVSKS